MKKSFEFSNHLILFAMIGFSPLATAIERPGGPGEIDLKPIQEKLAKGKEAKVRPFLGINAEKVNPLVLQQFDIKNAVLITHIQPGSPAAQAGLKIGDLITDFASEPIEDFAQLRAAVLAAKPDQAVPVKIIRRANAKEILVKLGEAPLQPALQRNKIPRADNLGALGLQQNQGNLGFNQRLQDALQQLQQINPALGRIDLLQLGKGLNAPLGGNIQAQAMMQSVVLDNEGSVTITKNNGELSVKVTDNAGQIIFEGPYKTLADRDAAPDDVARRLSKLNLPPAVQEPQPEIAPLIQED